MNNLKDIFDQEEQSIDVNTQLQPTGTIATNLPTTEGEASPYVKFGYGPNTIYNHNQGQVSV